MIIEKVNEYINELSKEVDVLKNIADNLILLNEELREGGENESVNN